MSERNERGQFVPKDDAEATEAQEPTNVTENTQNYNPNPALGIVQRQQAAAIEERRRIEAQAENAARQEQEDDQPLGVEAGTLLRYGDEPTTPAKLLEDGMSRGVMVGAAFGVAAGALLVLAVIGPQRTRKPKAEGETK